MREEFEKFKKVIANDDIIEYQIFHCYYELHSTNSTNKVKLKNSDAFFIDIFVIDYIDCSNNSHEEILEAYKKLNVDFHASFADYLLQQGFTNFFENGVFIPRALPQYVNDYYNELHNEYSLSCDRWGKGDYICMDFEVAGALLNIFPHDHYLPLQKNGVEFENDYYDCPKNPTDYLNNLFGDIWQFPQEIHPKHLHEIGRLSEGEIKTIKELGII